MSDVQQAAERVRRFFDKVPFEDVYGRELDTAELAYHNDLVLLGGAYALQSPTYAELTAKLAEAEKQNVYLERECVAFDDWTSVWVRIGGDLVRTLEAQTEHWTRPVRPIVLGASLIDDIRKAVEMPPAIGVHVTNSSEIPNSSAHRDQMAVDLNAVNSFARTLGFGQGELDSDLAGCLASAFDGMRSKLAEAEPRIAYFDDPTPLTPEAVMRMLPAKEGDDRAEYSTPVGTLSWFIANSSQTFYLRLNGNYINVADLTLGAFRRLATGLGIQLKEDA